MPALKGSLTYARYFVSGDLPADHRERFLKVIRLRAMKPLEPEDEELERSGWSKIGEPFVVDLSHEDVFYNEYINLGFRTDRWKLSPSLVKKTLRDAEAAYLEKKGREKLSRTEKSELKMMVVKKLRRAADPATRTIDVSWSLNDGIVRFFSHAAKPGAQMMELFKKTFSLALIPESPYTLAERIGLDKAQKSAWQDMDMTCLASSGPPPRQPELDAAAEEE